MEATVADSPKGGTWSGGGSQPFDSSYGKMMMWFFIMSDALTFSGFLGAYGFIRFKYLDSWSGLQKRHRGCQRVTSYWNY